LKFFFELKQQQKKLGDAVELAAISHVFEKNRKNKIQVSSIKGSIGHLLGASGSVEAISTILTIKNVLFIIILFF